MTGQLSTSANAAIPAGLRRKPALDAENITGHAAGILHVAPDGDILLLKRAGDPEKDNFVGHWALPGGGVEDGETPELGAVRENREELGVDVDPEALRDFDKRATPTGMAFHTFAAKAPSKFSPKLNDEHIGYGWFSLNALPQPIHPAVEQSLKDRVGENGEIGQDGWETSRDGLLRWLDGADDEVDELTTDSALCMALDRDSVREKTRDGRLVVKKANITKANVCPYRGSEITNWKSLGLEPDRVYNLLRDPEELRKAAPTLNGVQLLIKHIPVHAKDHRPGETVGSLGTDAEFDGTYLTNSLFVNAQNAIDVIESGQQRELSAGYHYTADMTAGNFNGTAYDGVMRDIVFNHVALVEDGRAGPDVVVGNGVQDLDRISPLCRAALARCAMVAFATLPVCTTECSCALTISSWRRLSHSFSRAASSLGFVCFHRFVYSCSSTSKASLSSSSFKRRAAASPLLACCSGLIGAPPA